MVVNQIRTRRAETTRPRRFIGRRTRFANFMGRRDVGEPCGYVEWSEVTLTEYENRTGVTSVAR